MFVCVCVCLGWLAASEEQPSVIEESSSFGCLFVVRNKTSQAFVLFLFSFKTCSLTCHLNNVLVLIDQILLDDVFIEYLECN